MLLSSSTSGKEIALIAENKTSDMNNYTTLYKRAGMAAMFSLFILGSISVCAQKSVFDVIPGSGPKKSRPTTTRTSLPDIILVDKPNGDDERRNDDREFARRRRTHLPPGQAKKIYGGSARDYAPGQVKKRKYSKGGKHVKYNKLNKHYKHNKHDRD